MLRYLTAHPDSQSQTDQRALTQAGESSLVKLEALKPKINQKYELYEKLTKERRAENDREYLPWLSSSTGPESTDNAEHVRRKQLEESASSSEALAAIDNKDLAVRLAHSEIKRRALARRATRQAGISEEVEQERRTGGVWGNWEEALAEDSRGVGVGTLSHQLQKVRLQITQKREVNLPTETIPASIRSIYQYPAIPAKRLREIAGNSTGTLPIPALPVGSQPDPEQTPEPPPKEYTCTRTSPPLPAKNPLKGLDSPGKLAMIKEASLPRELSPSEFTFRPSAYLENGSPLRTIFLPPELRTRFLSIAEPNTTMDLETCGILCGTLISNALFISKLVIPEQKGTSDTCETLNETRIFDYVDGEDLMVLGWIHTHPTQTCFMSSRDLHTHSGYQVMISESIAIVCAPSKDE